jgi:hypothetical protein
MTPIFTVILWSQVLHSLQVFKHRKPSKWSNAYIIQQWRSTVIVLQDLQLRHSYFLSSQSGVRIVLCLYSSLQTQSLLFNVFLCSNLAPAGE